MSKTMTQEFEGVVYDARHGGPFDRGCADSYYGRSFRPHYFTGATYQSQEIIIDSPQDPLWLEYKAGYNYNEEIGDKKDWG